MKPYNRGSHNQTTADPGDDFPHRTTLSNGSVFRVVPVTTGVTAIRAWADHPWPMTPAQALALRDRLGWTFSPTDEEMLATDHGISEKDAWFITVEADRNARTVSSFHLSLTSRIPKPVRPEAVPIAGRAVFPRVQRGLRGVRRNRRPVHDAPPGGRVGSSAAPLPICCAPSPSATPLLLVQWRVKERSRGKVAQQTRARTGPWSSLCTGSPSHSPLPSHQPHPSRRVRERTGGRRGPATQKGGRRASSRLRPAGIIITLQHEPW